MHVLILGPTGTAGSALLQQALLDTRILQVTTLHRRSAGNTHMKLTEVIHNDFMNYLGLEQLLSSIDLCFFCLGISQLKEKNWDKFYQITHDYPICLAKALKAVRPEVTFCFLSGQGADPTGKSRVAFAKAKGAAENSLNALGLRHLYIFRPGYIHPEQAKSGRPLGERISGFLYPVIRHVFPRFIIRAEELAKGMINVGIEGYPEHLLHNNSIKKVALAV